MMRFLLVLSLLTAQAAVPNKASFPQIEQSLVKIVVLDSQGQVVSVGTGFFVGDGQFIATAAHVYLEAAKTVIERGGGYIAGGKILRSGERFVFPIELVKSDYGHDVALLRFDPNVIKKVAPNFAIKSLELDDKKPDVGDGVVFFGYFGSDDFPLLSRTVVAGFAASPTLPEQLVLDLPANGGQSGGPVLSLESGKVVGLVNSFVPVFLSPGTPPTHSGLSRSVEVVHLKRLIESADVR